MSIIDRYINATKSGDVEQMTVLLASATNADHMAICKYQDDWIKQNAPLSDKEVQITKERLAFLVQNYPLKEDVYVKVSKNRWEIAETRDIDIPDTLYRVMMDGSAPSQRTFYMTSLNPPQFVGEHRLYGNDFLGIVKEEYLLSLWLDCQALDVGDIWWGIGGASMTNIYRI